MVYVARRFCVILVLILASCAAGCANAPPKLVVAAPTVIERTPEGTVLQFEIAATNPNDDGLKLLELKYELSVNGVQTYTGRRSAQASLARKADGTLTIPAVVPDAELGWTESTRPPTAEFSLHGSLSYVAPDEIAQILYDAKVHRPKVGFSASGVVGLVTQTTVSR